MICDGPAYQGWPALAFPRTWRTKSSIISRAQSQESRRYIQRHEFITERKEALDRWGAHVMSIVDKVAFERGKLSMAALALSA